MERLEKERTRTERNVDGTIGKRTNENGTEHGWNGWKNSERERNDLDGGPPFITEWNDLKKVGALFDRLIRFPYYPRNSRDLLKS